jgi:hypothetical protein
MLIDVQASSGTVTVLSALVKQNQRNLLYSCKGQIMMSQLTSMLYIVGDFVIEGVQSTITLCTEVIGARSG